MNIKYALDEIKEIVLNLKNETHKERLVSYSVISAIMDKLNQIAESMSEEKTIPIAMYREYQANLLWNCESICGLDDGNNHDDSSHITWALSAIQSLRSPHCFNIE